MSPNAIKKIMARRWKYPGRGRIRSALRKFAARKASKWEQRHTKHARLMNWRRAAKAEFKFKKWSRRSHTW